MLRRVHWLVQNDVSGHHICPILKGKEIQEKVFLLDFLTLDDQIDRLSRIVGKELPLDAA